MLPVPVQTADHATVTMLSSDGQRLSADQYSNPAGRLVCHIRRRCHQIVACTPRMSYPAAAQASDPPRYHMTWV